MSATNYLQAALLDALLRGVAYSFPTTLYLALSSSSPTEAEGDSGAPWNVTEPSAQTQLTSALVDGTPYTSLAVQALSAAIAAGASLQIGTGDSTQTVTVGSAGAQAGATAIPVTSFNANANYGIGTLVGDTTTAYARVSIVCNTSNWSSITETSTGSSTDNAVALAYPGATSDYPASIAYGALFDAAGGGNCLLIGPLTTTLTITTGYAPYAPAGSVVPSLN